MIWPSHQLPMLQGWIISLILSFLNWNLFPSKWLDVNLHVSVQLFQQCRVSLQSGEGFTQTGGQSQDPWTGCPLWLHVLPQFFTGTPRKRISIFGRIGSSVSSRHISCVFYSNCIRVTCAVWVHWLQMDGWSSRPHTWTSSGPSDSGKIPRSSAGSLEVCTQQMVVYRKRKRAVMIEILSYIPWEPVGCCLMMGGGGHRASQRKTERCVVAGDQPHDLFAVRQQSYPLGPTQSSKNKE